VTDGFRLTEKTIPKNAIETEKEKEPFRMLVPIKTAQEVSRDVLNDEIVSLFHDENQVLFKTERFEIISRLINGQFPDYSQLIPEKFVTEVVIDREEFATAVKVVSVLGQRNNEIALTLQHDKKNLIIHSSDQTMGENQYIIPVKTKGDNLDIVFNWRHIADAIKALSGEDIFFGFQEETNPAMIKSLNDNSYFYILKPLVKG
jgi:DNA polymerase-3 subunit beta